MIQEEIWEGFGERMKMGIPMFLFGEGMNLGELQPYKYNILMAILIEVFLRELKDDERRTFEHLIEITQEIIDRFGLTAEPRNVERIVEGLLWSGKSELREPFSAPFFDPHTRGLKQYSFRYLKHDRESSNLSRNPNIVYKLSEEAQNIIFFTREAIEEFSIQIEQLYTLMLIKKGNFRSALNFMDVLLTKVKSLIQREREYRKDLQRNPKLLLNQDLKMQKDKEEEIRLQLEDEKQNFNKLNSNLFERTMNAREEDRIKISELEHKVRQAAKEHLTLVNEVYSNFAYELELRTKNISLLLKHKNVSFKEDIWEKHLLPDGISQPQVIDHLLSSFFSPVQDFMLPMEWIWQAQETRKDTGEEKQEVDEPIISSAYVRVVDWEEISDSWAPVFHELLDTSSASLTHVKLDGWSNLAVEMWMIFKNKPFTVPQHVPLNEKHEDQRVILMYHLFQKHNTLLDLQGKTIRTNIEKDLPDVWFGNGYISPLKLSILR